MTATATLSSEHAPRWLVRWLVTIGLLILIGLEAYTINWELGIPNRMETYLHHLNCVAAQEISRRAALLICVPEQ